MSPVDIGIIGILIFLALIALRVPIALAMFMVGYGGYAYLESFNAANHMLSTELFSSLSSYSLSVIPMFVWMGFLAYYSGIGGSLYNFAYRMIGHRPGGLAIARRRPARYSARSAARTPRRPRQWALSRFPR